VTKHSKINRWDTGNVYKTLHGTPLKYRVSGAVSHSISSTTKNEEAGAANTNPASNFVVCPNANRLLEAGALNKGEHDEVSLY
jgi:hypothetical protein